MSDKNIHSIILLRGLPGSGKSTLAKVLSENGKYPVFSIDDYFTDESGNYRFIFQDNHLAYEKCRTDTELAMQNGIVRIFVDNTFTMEWEMEPYFKLAAQNDYSIFVVTVENYHGGKNIHEIPDEQLERMKSKFRVKL